MKTNRALLFISVIFLGVGIGIFTWKQDTFRKKTQNVDLKNTNMTKQLSSEEFKEIISNKKVWVLDVRENYEFNEGHIKEAQLVPSTRFDESFEELRIKKSDKIAVYCRSGNRSSFITQKLNEKGYGNVFNLELGIADWQKNGFEVEK